MSRAAGIVQSIGTIINSTLGANAIAVFTQDYQPVFTNAAIIKVDVRDESMLMEHPIENGETLVDHQIYKPIEIELSLILTSLNYSEVYQEIKQLYQSHTLLIVQTKAETYVNQLIQSIPHNETAEIYNGFPLFLKLKQVQFANAITTETVQTKNNNDSSTVDRGNQQPKNATPAQTEETKSILSKIVYK